jgi:hypothetical protein
MYPAWLFGLPSEVLRPSPSESASGGKIICSHNSTEQNDVMRLPWWRQAPSVLFIARGELRFHSENQVVQPATGEVIRGRRVPKLMTFGAQLSRVETNGFGSVSHPDSQLKDLCFCLEMSVIIWNVSVEVGTWECSESFRSTGVIVLFIYLDINVSLDRN